MRNRIEDKKYWEISWVSKALKRSYVCEFENLYFTHFESQISYLNIKQKEEQNCKYSRSLSKNLRISRSEYPTLGYTRVYTRLSLRKKNIFLICHFCASTSLVFKVHLSTSLVNHGFKPHLGPTQMLSTRIYLESSDGRLINIIKEHPNSPISRHLVLIILSVWPQWTTFKIVPT